VTPAGGSPAGPGAAGVRRTQPRPPEVARVLHRAVATMRAGDMAPPGTTILAAVSGGADSLCLLHALTRLRRLLGIEVACFHFDHGLRPGSERDTGFVRRQAEGLGVPFLTERAARRPRRGQSVEAWARTARYEALDRAVRQCGADVAATGHTLDDQAETVLLAALRGGGLDAVAGIRPASPLVIRPLLEVRRAETEAFCRALGLRARRDPMNRDPAYLRVAVRRKVIPEIERATGRGVAESLARTAGLLREDARFLDGLAAASAKDVVANGDGEVRLRANALSALPGPLRTRVVRRALAIAGVTTEARHVDAVIDLAEGRPGRRAALPSGLLARRDREYVRLSQPTGGNG
jgi:tRNA(Ile)-lysidine synthase